MAAQVEADTTYGDTLGVGHTATIAQACGSRFTLANTPPGEWFDLFELAVQEQNDSLAQEVLARLVARDARPGARDDTYVLGMRTYLAFGRVAAAKALLVQVDALGSTARALQFKVHGQMLRSSENAGDTVRVHQEAEQQIAQGMKRIPHEPSYGYVLEGYRALMGLAVPEHDTSLPALAIRAQKDLQQFTPADQYQFRPQDRGDWATFSVDTVISRLAPKWYASLRYDTGPQAPHLQAAYWFPAPGRATSDTVFPVPGKVNLICTGGEPTDFSEWVFENGQVTGYMLAAHVRRWLHLYGSKGLVVVLVHDAKGYQWLDAGVSREVGWFATPGDEARLWRWYEQDYHHLPVTMAVQIVHSTWLPQPDGRRMTESPLMYGWYYDHYAGNVGGGYKFAPARDNDAHGACTVIGRTGRILYSGIGAGASFTGSDMYDAFVGERNVYDRILYRLFQGGRAALSSSSTPAPVGAVSPAATRHAGGTP